MSREVNPVPPWPEPLAGDSDDIPSVPPLPPMRIRWKGVALVVGALMLLVVIGIASARAAEILLAVYGLLLLVVLVLRMKKPKSRIGRLKRLWGQLRGTSRLHGRRVVRRRQRLW